MQYASLWLGSLLWEMSLGQSSKSEARLYPDHLEGNRFDPYLVVQILREYQQEVEVDQQNHTIEYEQCIYDEFPIRDLQMAIHLGPVSNSCRGFQVVQQ